MNRAQPDLEPISPELALVDPELAARARALLTDPPPPPRIEPVTSGGRRHGPLLAAAALALATLISTIGGAAVLSTQVAAERTAADAALRTPLLESASLSVSHTQTQTPSATTARPPVRTPVKRPDRPARPTRPVPEPTQTAAPRSSKPSRTAAPRVTKPPPAVVLAPDERPTLRWNDASAPYYDFVLWRAGERILDLWPNVPYVTLPRQWTFAGHGYRLAPGRYLWFVYPGIGPRQNARYGPLATSGSLVISDSG